MFFPLTIFSCFCQGRKTFRLWSSHSFYRVNLDEQVLPWSEVPSRTYGRLKSASLSSNGHIFCGIPWWFRTCFRLLWVDWNKLQTWVEVDSVDPIDVGEVSLSGVRSWFALLPEFLDFTFYLLLLPLFMRETRSVVVLVRMAKIEDGNRKYMLSSEGRRWTHQSAHPDLRFLHTTDLCAPLHRHIFVLDSLVS